MLAGMSLGTDLKRYSRGTMPRLALITIILHVHAMKFDQCLVIFPDGTGNFIC